MSQTSRDRDNSRRVRTHEKNSGETVRRLGTIIQSIFCAQSGAGIRLNFRKWSAESRYPGAPPPLLKNFRCAFSPDPTDCPWVSEDELTEILSTICPVKDAQRYVIENKFLVCEFFSFFFFIFSFTISLVRLS